MHILPEMNFVIDPLFRIKKNLDWQDSNPVIYLLCIFSDYFRNMLSSVVAE